MNIKRFVYLGHRWLGIALCLFMGLWFLSGVVMMYVGYPKLGQMERLQALPPLQTSEACCIPVAQALKALPAGMQADSLRLTSIAGQPHFVAGIGMGRYLSINALTGERVVDPDHAFALSSAREFLPAASMTHGGLLGEDAWTHSKALEGHRPLHRINVEHDQFAMLYISGVTGEVVRDVSVNEKYWNWLGAWLHWLYPLRGGVLDGWWRDIMIYTALAATVLSVIGMVVGCWRWRRVPYKHGGRSPYRERWMRWHHWLGLVFGALAITWIASGLFSMNPWRMFDSGAVRPLPQRLVLAEQTRQASLSDVLRCFRAAAFDPRELEWLGFGGKTWIAGRDGHGQVRLLQPDGGCRIAAGHTELAVQQEGERLMPHARLLSTRVQTDYDWHYYERAAHTMSGHVDKPLPVLVLTFDDPAASWLYMDLRTGRVLQRLDSHARVKRWLFALLHSWDWKPLLDIRPLWDILLVLASIGGFLLGVTGAVIGWRRLVRQS